MPDPKLDASTTQLLAAVHAKHDRLKRNRQAVAFLSATIPVKEKLLKDGMKMLAEYVESTAKLAKELEQDRKRLEFALTFCKDHEAEGKNLKTAEELAKKIARLQKQMQEGAERLKKLEGIPKE